MISDILHELRQVADSSRLEGMARYGITTDSALGVSIPDLRRAARKIGENLNLASELWQSGIHEARILASMIVRPDWITESLMDQWVAGFNSWDLCDQCCNNLFVYTQFAHKKALEWSLYDKEFIKRASFTLMACLAVHDKTSSDEPFIQFLERIENHAIDERNYVKKAVNWALRQIGKRNSSLNKKAISSAETILKQNSKSSRWIAKDALRELTNLKIQQKVNRIQ
jgi:3-methyladenine DNA glycosylase AlkD